MKARDIKPTDISSPKTFVMEISYYMKRLKLVLIDVVAAKPSTPD